MPSYRQAYKKGVEMTDAVVGLENTAFLIVVSAVVGLLAYSKGLSDGKEKLRLKLSWRICELFFETQWKYAKLPDYKKTMNTHELNAFVEGIKATSEVLEIDHGINLADKRQTPSRTKTCNTSAASAL